MSETASLEGAEGTLVLWFGRSWKALEGVSRNLELDR